MPVFIATIPILFLLGLTALGYALATVGMKMASLAPSPMAFVLMIAGLLTAVLAEVTLLRLGELPVVYIGIITAESLLVLGYAAVIGDRLGPAQIAGAALVLAGFALVTLRA